MISIEKYRKSLNDQTLSEDQIKERMAIQYKFADILFDSWLRKKNQQRIASVPESDQHDQSK